jgi:hypothetical protein
VLTIRIRSQSRDWLPEIRYALDSLISVRRLAWRVVDDGESEARATITYGDSDGCGGGRGVVVPRYRGVVRQRYETYDPGSVPFLTDTRFGPAPPGQALATNGEGSPLATCTADGRVVFGFDIVANIFLHLSCSFEYERERQHGPIHSYAARLSGGTPPWSRPVVDYYFMLLERALSISLDGGISTAPRPERRRFAVALTHDVDAIEPTAALRAKRLAFAGYNAVRALSTGEYRRAAVRALADWRIAAGGGDWRFEDIESMEQRHGWTSTYFVYAGTRSRASVKRALLDPDYNLDRQPRLQAGLRGLTARGHEVALHGSFDSYASRDRFVSEKTRLEQALGQTVMGSRQHWLRFSLATTWRLCEELGITYDSTLGFNDAVGFRAGIAAPFRPYDHERRRAFDVVEVPLVVMDSTLFDYERLDARDAYQRAVAILDEVRAVGGGCAILWHSQAFADEFGWSGVYRILLDWIADHGGTGAPCHEIVRAYAS